MPYELLLPPALSRNLWKVKIFEKETVEPPHVTIIRGTRRWRINLRDMRFLDKEPDPSDVPRDLLKFVRENKSELVKQWDKKYPHNVVGEAL